MREGGKYTRDVVRLLPCVRSRANTLYGRRTGNSAGKTPGTLWAKHRELCGQSTGTLPVKHRELVRAKHRELVRAKHRELVRAKNRELVRAKHRELCGQNIENW